MIDKRQTNIQNVKSQFKEAKTELKNGVFFYTGPMTVSEFAIKIGVIPTKIVKQFFIEGKMLNLNSTLKEEQIAELCIQHEYDFNKITEVNEGNIMDEIQILDDEFKLKIKPPIVTIMGHVDHGKTTLIDNIRNTNVAGGEYGGITQHTGAYQIIYKNKKITFIDTPGHEAFTAMRSRGAQVTNIVVLVVAVDDGVMPQTKEAIDHAKSAGCPIIVFINKMDKVGINLEKIKGDLSALDIIADDWGGNYQFIYGSGLTGEGIDKLFAAINIEAEMLELKGNPERLPSGTVIDSRLDKGRGSVVTIIVENGTIIPRDFIVAGSNFGRVRSLENMRGDLIKSAGPGTPAIITGLNYTPLAGDKFLGFKNEKFAKDLANKKAFSDKQKELKQRNSIQIKDGIKVLYLIIKSDVQGTSEAIKYALNKIENSEAKVNIVRASAGLITKSDILLAQASKAIIFGFNIRPTGDVKQFAKQEKIIIKTHNIIYKMVEEVTQLLKGMMAPKFEEKVIGQAKIIKVIFSSKIGNIAGSLVINGVIKLNSNIRLIRNGITIHEGILDSLYKEKNSVSKIENGYEFGTHIKKYNNIKLDDIIECYENIKIEL